jgi:hypothetical protein
MGGFSLDDKLCVTAKVSPKPFLEVVYNRINNLFSFPN